MTTPGFALQSLETVDGVGSTASTPLRLKTGTTVTAGEDGSGDARGSRKPAEDGMSRQDPGCDDLVTSVSAAVPGGRWISRTSVPRVHG